MKKQAYLLLPLSPTREDRRVLVGLFLHCPITPPEVALPLAHPGGFVPLNPIEQVAADALRALGYGDRRIAEALGTTHWNIRKDRSDRLDIVAEDHEPHAVIVNEYMVAFYV